MAPMTSPNVPEPLPAAPPTGRLMGLDALRGVAIAGMVLANNPGSWSHVLPPLAHAEWHGCTPTDLVFPFFLFAAGAAMAFSLRRDRLNPQANRRDLWLRLGRRVLILLGLGLFLNGFPAFDWANWRFPGVLQRIALAYGLTATLVLWTKRRGQVIAAIAVLLGYWIWLVAIPVPGAPGDPLSPEGNWVGYLDRAILGAAHLYKGGPFDPEGLLSTLPAAVTTLFGYWAGEWLRDRRATPRTSLALIWTGCAGIALGSLWHWGFPINKPLWTSSYVLFSAGWGAIALGLWHELADVRRRTTLTKPFVILGMNAIAIFVGSGLLGRILHRTHIGDGDGAPTTYTWLYQTFFASWAGPWPGSLLFAIAMLSLWWAIAWGLHRRRWFFKV
ncbi:MAG: DUF5009 domain-containing protein [Cyanophyceae cyanobacterium]